MDAICSNMRCDYGTDGNWAKAYAAPDRSDLCLNCYQDWAEGLRMMEVERRLDELDAKERLTARQEE